MSAFEGHANEREEASGAAAHLDGVEAGLGDEGAFVGREPTPFVQVRFVAVEMVLPATNPTLVLQEIDPPQRRLEIAIGMAEGVAIAYAARRIPTPRPLTHELFIAMLSAFDVELAAVRITHVSGSSYEAEIAVASRSGARTFPSRVSDAVALVLRQRLAVPITVAPAVLREAGI